MSWQGIEGHDQVVEQFRRRIASGRLASTFLFIGPAGIGKRSFAMRLAQTLLCQQSPPENMAPCNACSSCKQVIAQSHPDLILVSKPSDKNFIPIEMLIGDREHRMQEGLCHDIARKPNAGSRKIAIIDDADYFNQEGANCLLKTLEEPPPGALLILLGTSEQRQLPTIRSRSQVIRFAPLATEICSQLILENSLVEDEAAALPLAQLAGGSLELARELADTELREFRKRFLARLAQKDWDNVALAKAVGSFVDEAGKEASLRRARLRQLIRFAIELYRHAMLLSGGSTTEADPVLTKAAEDALATLSEESAAASIDRSLDALDYVDANANLSTLIECWLDDLATISRGQVVPLGGLAPRASEYQRLVR